MAGQPQAAPLLELAERAERVSVGPADSRRSDRSASADPVAADNRSRIRSGPGNAAPAPHDAAGGGRRTNRAQPLSPRPLSASAPGSPRILGPDRWRRSKLARAIVARTQVRVASVGRGVEVRPLQGCQKAEGIARTKARNIRQRRPGGNEEGGVLGWSERGAELRKQQINVIGGHCAATSSMAG